MKGLSCFSRHLSTGEQQSAEQSAGNFMSVRVLFVRFVDRDAHKVQIHEGTRKPAEDRGSSTGFNEAN
jgi:hypothetical protein